MSERRLALRSFSAAAVGAVVVACCYFFVDRPVAWFVDDRHLADRWLRWLTLPPPIVQEWSPAALTALALRRAFGPLPRGAIALAAACVAMIVADQFRETLGYIFGRYWPDTWIDENPSLIKDGAYGFHPFHRGPAYGSFPSGHMARTVALVAVFWIAYPRWRWLSATITAALAIALIGMNYHFVGDVIAGGTIGGIIGAWAAAIAALQPRQPNGPAVSAPL
jgi:membrane-associated phospholipid phosphatase